MQAAELRLTKAKTCRKSGRDFFFELVGKCLATNTWHWTMLNGFLNWTSSQQLILWSAAQNLTWNANFFPWFIETLARVGAFTIWNTCARTTNSEKFTITSLGAYCCCKWTIQSTVKKNDLRYKSNSMSFSAKTKAMAQNCFWSKSAIGKT